ncbi:hypothetical protein D3C71_1261090 [compost metagenome]
MHMGEALGCNPRAVVHVLNGKAAGWHRCRQRQGFDLRQHAQVRGIRCFLVTCPADRVGNDGWLELHPLPRLPGGRVGARFQHALQPVLVQLRAAVRARKHLAHALAFVFQRLIKKVHRARAFRATEHLAPHRIFDAALGLAIAVQRFIHPTDVLLHRLEQLLACLGEGVHIEGNVVVRADESGGG